MPSVRNTRFESASDVQWLKYGAFDVQGIGTYPSVKLIKRLGTLPEEQLVDVELRVRQWSFRELRYSHVSRPGRAFFAPDFFAIRSPLIQSA